MRALAADILPSGYTQRVRAESEPRLRLTRRGRLVFLGLPLLLLATALLIMIGFLTAPLKADSAGLRGMEAVSVTVQPGDSLWSLTAQTGLDRNPGDLVAEIVELNGLSSAVLQPGQPILLPTR